MYRVQFQVREKREWISAPYKSTVFDKYEDALTYFNRQIKLSLNGIGAYYLTKM